MAIISAIKVINNDCFYAPSIIAIGQWEEIGLDTYLTIKEATVPIRNPTATIVDSSRQVFSRLSRNASVLSLRMRYPSSGTVTAHPVARVFGRTRLPSDAVDDWQLMLSRHA